MKITGQDGRYFRDEKGQSKIHYKYPERLENRIVPVAE